jgi:hypothetical protein
MKTQKYYSKVLAEIGAKLVELRQKKGYSTIKAFTLDYDLPEIQYWRMEKGKANITIRSLMKVLAIHKVSFPDFFCMLTSEEKVK